MLFQIHIFYVNFTASFTFFIFTQGTFFMTQHIIHRHFNKFALFILVILGSHVNFSYTKCDCDQKTQVDDIKTFIQHKIPNATTSLLVTDAHSGKKLLDHNGHKNFIPASLTKIFTAYTALIVLNQNYKYTTSVYLDHTAPILSKLDHDLYIEFTGDPSLTHDNILELIKKIKAKGIQTITSDIVLDISRFQGSEYPLGFDLADKRFGYGAPISTVILNQNKIPVSITPSKTLGQPATCTADIQNDYTPIIHTNIITVTAEEAENKYEFNVSSSEKNELNIVGAWPINRSSGHLHLAVQKPLQLAKDSILSALKKHNIIFKGTFKIGALPEHTKVLAQHQSKSLDQLIHYMLEHSSSLYANAILKTIGAIYHKEPGTFLNGISAMKAVLTEKTDIDTNHLTLCDGAGFSFYNSITPYQMNQLLHTIYQNKQLFPLFLSFLSKPNQPGRLKYRMNSIQLQDHVFAKPGKLTHIFGLAGYVKKENGHYLIFTDSIMNCLANRQSVHKIEDQMLSMIQNLACPQNKPNPLID